MRGGFSRVCCHARGLTRRFGGPKSTAKSNEPVTQVSYADAEAYAKWTGKRLPTEAEYEFAARGGQDGKHFAWGDELKPRGAWPANIWQGSFPSQDTGEDGYKGTSPVKAFPPNGYGLYDVGGNVWQWCDDSVGSLRVNRGGAWYSLPRFCRAAIRTGDSPADRHRHLGFRPALVLPGK